MSAEEMQSCAWGSKGSFSRDSCEVSWHPLGPQDDTITTEAVSHWKSVCPAEHCILHRSIGSCFCRSHVCEQHTPNVLPSTCKCSANTCWMLKGTGQIFHPFEGNRETEILSHADNPGLVTHFSVPSLPSNAVRERGERSYYISRGW